MTELEKAKRKADELCEAWGMEDNHGYSVKDTFKVGFAQGVKWKAEQSPWISVEERLPEHMQAVWVRSNINNYHPLRFCNGKFYTSFAHQTYDGSVTHWMPIPE